MITAQQDPRVAKALQTGVARGFLPADATLPTTDERPWPVVLLTALGAWLAAIPLMGVIGMLLGDLIGRSAGPYILGVLLLAGAVTVLRSKDLAVFVEQLAVPAFLAALGALAFGLFRDLPMQVAAALLCGLLLALAWAIDRAWLRVLLGAAAAVALVFTLLPERFMRQDQPPLQAFWLALHVALGVWVLAMVVQQRSLQGAQRAPLAAALEATASGWLLLVLAGLAAWSGMSFMMAASLGNGIVGMVAQEVAGSVGRQGAAMAVQAGSAVAGGVAVVLAGRRWPALRHPLAALVGVVLAALGWLMPALGGALLVLAFTATSQRWRLAASAATAAVWIVGGFYYQLQWTLTHKALVLLGAAALLGAIAWVAQRHSAGKADTSQAAAAPASAPPWRAGLMLAAAAATLALVNFSIWQKEDLIARGDKVCVELASVDPRSLMQGDFMRLNYRVPQPTDDDLHQRLTLARPHVVARIDARGVATLQRVVSANAPLAAGEMRIELTPKGERWMLVSDAWFFRDGDGKRWEAARYGEFRVTPDGKALLVGLADAQLQAISAKP